MSSVTQPTHSQRHSCQMIPIPVVIDVMRAAVGSTAVAQQWRARPNRPGGGRKCLQPFVPNQLFLLQEPRTQMCCGVLKKLS